MWRDLVFSLRALRRSPLFTLVAVLSLALGIGANTAIFSLLDQVVLRSLPVRDPETLTVLHREYNPQGSSSSDNSESVFSYPMYRDLRDRDPAFSGIVARMGAPVRMVISGATSSGSAEIVSGNFFATLGVGAALGRALAPADDGPPGAHAVAVLSHSFWESRFGSSPAVLNQTITLNGHPFVVLGVAEARFKGLMQGQTPDVFVPIAMQRAMIPNFDALEDRQIRWLNLFARLKPGESLRQAQAATDVVYHSIVESELAQMGRMRSEQERVRFLNHRTELRPAAQGISSLRNRWEKPLQVLMIMVGLVLLIACANVAGLLLARATGRQREIAIRLAVGAGRAALVRQLLLEGLVLALAGGAAGLLVERWSTKALLRALPRDAVGTWLTTSLDWRLLGFALALSVASGLVFALVPALQATRPGLSVTLKDQASGIASGGRPARLRQVVVIAQVTLSMLLVVGAGLLSVSARNLLNANLGFRSQHVLMFFVNATLGRPGVPAVTALYHDLQERLLTIPEVSGVGVAIGGPFSGANRGGNITVEGYQAREDEYTGSSIVAVGPGYFRALGIPLRAGREFSDRDDAAAPKTVLVNESFVKRYFAGRQPLGKRLMFGASNHPVLDKEIVGVVADNRSDPRAEDKPTLYYPYPQWQKAERMVYYLRVAGDDNRVASAIRGVVREADPNLPVASIRPVEVYIRESLYTDRLVAILAGAFGALATLLAAIGLYGVVAYAVARRTGEIGVRMALGALPGKVLRMVLGEAFRMAGVGIAIGLGAAFVLSRYIESQLFGVKPADPAIYAAAAVVLAAVALAAAFIPGWRASRVDPVTALKYE